MLTIYTHSISQRLSYVVETLFEDLLGLSVLITLNKDQLDRNRPCLNYSHEEIEGVYFIRPHSLLFEEGIRTLSETMDEEGLLFPTESDIVNQDILAASFFLLTRYEEYLDTDTDAHGRKQAKNSQMHRAGLLGHPLVDEWTLELYQKFLSRYPEFPALNRSFTILPTFDVDIAYMYRGRSFLRKWKSSLKDIGTFDGERLKERKAVLREELPDPSDSYAFQKSSCEAQGLECRHFFLLGDRGPLDHNLPHTSKELQSLITEIDGWSTLGIHPSMGSNENESTLKKEIQRLRKITKSEVKRSRQHYLYLDLPLTYQRLIRQGITEDYSMGYADHIGFRAGTCSIFRWFDLSTNAATPLYLAPISVMDSTLRDYMGLDISSAIQVLEELKGVVKKVDGIFVPLWHNHSIADYGEWKGWRKVYEKSISQPA